MAHAKVRQSISENMKRQKQFHEESLSFETFELGDKVYVYYPVKKIGSTLKLTSYRRGPYQVIDKLSDALYKVNCGREGLVQVIHCDRLRKARQQVLAREDYVYVAQENTNISDLLSSMTDDKEYEIDFTKQKRMRRKPKWMKNYILLFPEIIWRKLRTRQERSHTSVEHAKKHSNPEIHSSIMS